MADVRADLELGLNRAYSQIGQLESRLDAVGGRVNIETSGFDDATESARRLEGEIDDVSDATDRAEQSSIGLRDALGAAVAVLGAREIVRGIRAVVDAASELEESTTKAAAVFGDNFSIIEDQAADAAQTTGLAADAFLDATGTLGNFFTAQGVASGRAADLSANVVQLAADVASFNDIELEESITALRSGLAGEIEPLRRLGISFNAAAVEARALEMGLGDAHGEIDEGAKLLARYDLIMEQTTTVQGDFARTSEGLANQQRILAAEFRNAQTEIGQALLPSAKEIVTLFREDGVPAVESLGTALAEVLIPALEAAAPLFGTTTTLLTALAPLFEALAVVLNTIPAPLLSAVAAGAAFSRLSGPLSRSLGSLRGVFSGVAGSAGRLSGALTTLARGGAFVALGLLLDRLADRTRAADDAISELLGGVGDVGTVFETEFEQSGAQIEALRDRVAELRERAGGSIDLGFTEIFATNEAADFGAEAQAAEEALADLEERQFEIARKLPTLRGELDLTNDEIFTLAEAAGIDLASLALPDAIEAMLAAKAASDEFGDAQGDAADETLGLADAIDEVERRQRALVDPVFALSEASNEFADAQEAANDAIAEFGPESDEAKAAGRDLVDALLNLQGAAVDADLDFDAFERRLDEWVATGRITAEQADAIRGSIDEARLAAQEYEGDYRALVELLGADEARDALLELVQLADSLADRITLQAQVDTGPLRSFARGDIFPARPGGHIIRVAEAGAAEVVVPTDDRARAAELLARAGLGDLSAGRTVDYSVTQNIYTADPLRAGDESVNRLREDAYLGGLR